MKTDYPAQIAEYNRAVNGNLNTWVAAAGGKEPITKIDGRHYQMMFNPATRERMYYCWERDMFPAYVVVPVCLIGRRGSEAPCWFLGETPPARRHQKPTGEDRP